ncbi:MAG: response regulator transcription factor [Pseudomonadota bacterium]|nr:response regulator transcription factor [Pseudomonadota bacterium]
MGAAPTRILLADDHALLRDGLRRLIERIEGVEVVAEAEDGKAVIGKVRDNRPELVLLDVALPLLNGLDACAQIVKRFKGVKVLMVSSHANEAYVLKALQNGAKGYMLKSASAAELEVAIKSTARGKRYLSPEVSGFVIDAVISGEKVDSPLDLLTGRQREVLQLIAEGMTNREMAEHLDVAESTIETHRTNLMNKLDIHDLASLVLFAVRSGLVDGGHAGQLDEDPGQPA